MAFVPTDIIVQFQIGGIDCLAFVQSIPPAEIERCNLWTNGSRLSLSIVIDMTLAGLEPAIFGSEDQRLIH
jgi:hypothetical protein